MQTLFSAKEINMKNTSKFFLISILALGFSSIAFGNYDHDRASDDTTVINGRSGFGANPSNYMNDTNKVNPEDSESYNAPNRRHRHARAEKWDTTTPTSAPMDQTE